MYLTNPYLGATALYLALKVELKEGLVSIPVLLPVHHL